jgi:TrmH family RNA methyltransferase
MNYTRITSSSNPRVKEAVALRKKRSGREPRFLIEGPHLAEMAVSSGATIHEVFFTDIFGSKKDGQKLLRRLSKYTEKIFEVTEHLINKITATDNPQGIAAVASCKAAVIDELPPGNNPFLIVIDGVQDPGNLGTIIRTSDAAGSDAVILLPGTCDPFVPKTIRSTAGSIFNEPLIFMDTASSLDWLHSRNIRVAVTAADAGRSVFDEDLTGGLALVFGNEAHGVSRTMKGFADLTLRIPIYGKAESLNVAAAAAVCIYEAVRQRKTQSRSDE